MNLKPKCKPAWHELFHKKIVAIYIALALVLLINQIVFTYVLTDREKVKAFDTTISAYAQSISNLGNQTVSAGTNDVVLAEFFMPDAMYFNENVACNGSMVGNPCVTIIDANGALDGTSGADDDGFSYFWQVEPQGRFFRNKVRKADKICYDNAVTPTCVYYEPDFVAAPGGGENPPENCPGSDGNEVYLIGAACALGTDWAGGADGWSHSEIMNTDDAAIYSYDWCGGPTEPGCGSVGPLAAFNTNAVGGTLYFENSGVCGGTNGLTFEADIEPVWDDVFATSGLGTAANFDPGIDTIYWDPSHCLTTNTTCTSGGCAGNIANSGAPFMPYFLNDGTSCGTANTSDGVWEYPEPIWNDLPSGNDGTYDTSTSDVAYWDPSGCLSDGSSTGIPLLNPGQLTETLRLVTAKFDTEVQPKIDSTACYHGADRAVDCDGSDTNDVGFCDLISNGDSLTPLNGTENLCTDSLTVPTRVFVHSGYTSKCNTATGTWESLRNPSIAGSYTDVASNWAYLESNGTPGWQIGEDLYNDFYDTNGNPGTVYDRGINATMSQGAAFPVWPANATYFDTDSSGNFDNGEPVVIDMDSDGFYSLGDTDVYSSGAVLGDPLISLTGATGPAGSSVYYVDYNNDSSFSCADSIWEDAGNIQDGNIDNGVVDMPYDLFNALALNNLGSAQLSSDITNLRVYGDFWWWNGIFGYQSDGRCGQAGGIGDEVFAKMGLSGSNTWVSNSLDPNQVVAGNVTPFYRACLVGDITPEAINGRTIQLQFPQLYDQNSNGLYNVGDKGLFFNSTNDGLTDAAYDLPYTITIQSSNYISYGGGTTTPADTTAPGMVTNVVISANSSGNVTISWQDPTDTDLSQILIEEMVNGQVLGDYISKGVQTKTLTGRIVGKTYSYRLRAQDTSGNLGIGLYYYITIPVTGEAQAEAQALPAPEAPGLILQDPEPAGSLPQDVKVGDLVKSAQAGAIYFIDQDNRRHVFPNDKVYMSYYPDFNNIDTLSDTTLAAIPLGSNVTMRPGTWLVKIQSDPRVYAVEPYGVLRWISSEAVANALYGADWNSKIIDVESTFFINYQTGAAIISNVHPTGAAFSYAGETKIYYVDQGKKKLISTDVFINNKFQNKFIIRNIDKAITYEDGDALTKLNMEAIMTLK
ncbi:MAG: hypothetical protein NTX82_05460 [Candidatus Parcubacteria bacterium]|nr:hypothetical protein [Candidatus Parcubacteria bacterium]